MDQNVAELQRALNAERWQSYQLQQHNNSNLRQLQVKHNEHMAEITRLSRIAEDLEKKIDLKNAETDKLKTYVKEALSEQTAEVKELEATVADRDRAIKTRDRQIKRLEQQVERLQKQVPSKKRKALAVPSVAKKPQTQRDAVEYAESSSSEEEATPVVAKRKTVQELRWDQRFQELIAFKEQHGHCDVSKAHPEFKSLLMWVNDQRTRHRWTREGRTDGMDSNRIRRLRSIGFQFQIVKHDIMPFEKRFEQLLEYKRQHGHTNVPQKCKSPAGLGNFVLELRRMYRQKKSGDDAAGQKKSLTPERIELMNSIEFQWSLRNRSGKKQQKVESNGEDTDVEELEALLF